MSLKHACWIGVVGFVGVVAIPIARGQNPPVAAVPPKPFTSLANSVDIKLRPLDPAFIAENPDAKAQDDERTRARATAYMSARKVFLGTIPADDAGKKILDGWYKSYFLPSFTIPENWGKLPELRQDLLIKDFRTARSPAALAHVRTMTLTYMRLISQSPGAHNFHPAVRYNAMLLIGSLNAIEYGARDPNAADARALAPDPLPEAFDVLLAEYQSPTQIDAVRVAALIGLDRHVRLDLVRPANRRIPGAKKRVVADEMLALLESAPPASRSSEGHTWMQRRAIDILASLGMVGVDPKMNAVLAKIVADEAAPISLRCTASEALAHWSADGKQKIDATALSRQLGILAVKACADELTRIGALGARERELTALRELLSKPNPAASGAMQGQGMMTGAGGGYPGAGEMGYGESMSMEESMPQMDMMGMGGYGEYGQMMGGIVAATVPVDPRVDWSRRRLKYQLTCVKLGLDGMKVAAKADAAQVKNVEAVLKGVTDVLAAAEPPADKPTLAGFAKSVREAVGKLAFLTPAAAAAAAVAVEDELPSDDVPPGPGPEAATPPDMPVTPEEAPDDLPPGF